VAENAGVSKATVSRVLNNDSRVDPVLKQRVITSIEFLGYEPSVLASSLRRQETFSIGIVVPDNRNPFFAELTNVIESTLQPFNYSVYLCNSAEDGSKELTHCQHLYRQRVAGIVLATTGQTEKAIKYLKSRKTPFVLIDRGYPGNDVDCIMADHYQGARLATEYLVSLGHKLIGIIAGPPAHPPVQDRVRGFEDTLEKHGLYQDPEMICWFPRFDHKAGYDGAKLLFSLTKRPTAIFAFNDIMAIGALSFALENRIEVPKELSIIGVDNISLSGYVTPKLTTVEQPIVEIGRAAAKLLLQRIQETSTSFVQQVLPSKLVVRDSTASVDDLHTSHDPL